MKHVAVGIISRERQGGEREYLLVKSTNDFGAYTGHYYPPGGHVEAAESAEQTLVREMQEELGLDVRPLREIAVTPGDVPNQSTHWWTCAWIGGTLLLQKDEIADAGFFTRDEMAAMPIWPATRAFFQQHPDSDLR